MSDPQRTRDEVIDATLKAACIRASATVYGPQEAIMGNDAAREIVDFAQKLYREAKNATWE